MKNKKEIRASAFFESDVEESVSMIMPILTDCDVDEDFSEGVEKIKDEIPILPLRNMVLFPGVAMPVIVGRSKSLNLIKNAKNGNQDAITELYNRTYNNVYFTVKALIKSEDTILDIVQDSKLFKR